ncbi:MAG TPA: hypothetical protein VMS84_17560 [Mycobacterium sp.]|jgi:hypothetical protein|nr:hypothetical protein [Mycobacterium sp.]
MTDTGTYADGFRKRIKALTDDDELREAGGSMSAIRAVRALIVSGADLTALDADGLYGLDWLCSHAELDAGLLWCGGWHVPR